MGNLSPIRAEAANGLEDFSESIRPLASLMDRTEAAVCAALGVHNLRHRAALRRLSDISRTNVPRLLFDVIADNYVRGGATLNKNRSQQNWRWCNIQPQIGAANRSPEVVLERAIAASCLRAGRADWGNQVPVASGLILGASDRRRAIDLVHRRGERHFEFIELKIASDTPLYAAIEIIGYACIWLLARGDRPSRRSALLDAEQIDLRVLAPAAFYGRYELQALESSLHQSLGALGDSHGVTLTFAFDVLDDHLSKGPLAADDALLSLLAARQPLASSFRR